jgi:hypothetical protein
MHQPHSTPGKTRYPLYRRLGGPQGRSGWVRKNLAPTGFRSPDRPARSQSLYRLNYRAHIFIYLIINAFGQATDTEWIDKVHKYTLYWLALPAKRRSQLRLITFLTDILIDNLQRNVYINCLFQWVMLWLQIKYLITDMYFSCIYLFILYLMVLRTAQTKLVLIELWVKYYVPLILTWYAYHCYNVRRI